MLNPVRLYRIPFIREKIAQFRFEILSRLKIRESPSIENVLHQEYSKMHFGAYSSISERVSYLVNTVEVILKGGTENLLVLGPRYETELFGYRSLTPPIKNVIGVDTFSYSKRILTGNMHQLPFEDKHFDLVVCGWTLAYSNSPKQALEEISRVAKDDAQMLFTFDLNQNEASMSIDKLVPSNMNLTIRELFRDFKIKFFNFGYVNWAGDTPICSVVVTKN